MRAQAWPYADLKYPFSVDEGGSFAEYLLKDPESMPHLSLGSRVLIHDKRGSDKIWMEATVVGIRAVSPFNTERQNLLYIQEEEWDPQLFLKELNGPHRIQMYLIRVKLNKEIVWDSDNNRFQILPIQRPPSASSYLTFPTIHADPSNEDREPSLAEMLEIKQEGIRLGAVGFGNYPYEENGKFLIYHLDLKKLDNKHMFIVGESGSGKTVLLKNLAAEIKNYDKQCRIIMTDVQGDLSQILLDDIVTSPEIKGWQCRVATRLNKEQAIGSMKPFNLVIPAIKDQLPQHIVALKKLAQNRGVNVFEIGLRLRDLNAPSEVEYLFRVTSEQVAMLLDEEVENFKNDNRIDQITIENLKQIILTAIQRSTRQNNQNNIQSSVGTTYYKSTGYAALRALKNLSNYFDFHQLSMNSPDNPLDCLNSEGTTIIYLEHLNYEERLMWEMQLVKWLYDNKSMIKSRYYVFVDEAHQIVPAKPPGYGSKGTFDRLRSNFEKLAREGRKFGINMILSTQSPNDLHEIVPDQCPTRIVMKIDPKNASYAHLDSDLASIASRFGHGQFWLKSPFNDTLEWVRIHSWAPELPHQPMFAYWDNIIKKARDEK